MLDSLAFYIFLLLIAYVIYWSVKNDNGPQGAAEKKPFSIDDARKRSKAGRSGEEGVRKG